MIPVLAVWIVLPLFFTGCKTTTGGYIQANYTTVSQLQEADKFFDSGKYQTALLKYSSFVYAPFSNKKHEDYALYKMGLCQFLIGQYYDARKTVNNLIQTYPDFEYKQQATDLLVQSEQKIAENKEQITKKWSELLAQISVQEQRLSNDAQNPAYIFQLGDLYWEAGRFEDAVKQYETAVRLDKSYLEKKTLRDRIRITTDGEFRVRDPLFENIEKPSPIRVVNVKRDRIRREDWLGQYESLRLSGNVENQGLFDVNNVRIEIAIFDFFDTVQETKIVPIGELRAGGRRPFSVLFNEYRGMAVDISRYTTEVFYDEPLSMKRL